MLIDTHCHLDDPTLLRRLPSVLAAAAAAGVGKFIVPGVSPDGWDAIASLAGERQEISPAFGLHPMHADQCDEKLLVRLARFARNAVAIGEIGLDYSLADIPRETQIEAFRSQLRIAVDSGLPVLIHCRRAFQDMLKILREENVARVGGVMHAFSGSPEVALECIDMGLHIAVAGPVTYRNALKPLQVVRAVPFGCLVLETDAPDMTPEPHRGRDNEPAFLVEIARKVAEIKSVSVVEVEGVTTANALRLFRI
jgi:TatD DNase family protein